MTKEKLVHARVEFAAAAVFVGKYHRHHTPPVGHLFSIGAYRGGDLISFIRQAVDG